jgi:hypothetical protein
MTYASGIQPGVREDILGGYVKLKKTIYTRILFMLNIE